MTWLVEDRKGEIHELLEDERVLIVGPNENYSRNWLLTNQLPHYGHQFTVPQHWYTVAGGNWSVVIWLEGWEFSEEADHFKRLVPNLAKVQREIFV